MSGRGWSREGATIGTTGWEKAREDSGVVMGEGAEGEERMVPSEVMRQRPT